MASYIRTFIKFFTLIFLLYSCSVSRKTVTTPGSPDIEDYALKYCNIAIMEMKRVGIPASITLSQGILESKYGNSRLAREANNHFGIKCHSNWSGKRIYEDDDEKQECFRVYNNAEESFIDHSDFLKNPRYLFLYKYKKTDYKSWAHGLKKAGYATNPKYPKLLIDLIEKYKLYKYDQKIFTHYTTRNEEVFEFNRIKTILAEKGVTPLRISSRYEISLKRLYKYNDMKKGDLIRPGSKIYLQPKRKKGNTKYHIVKINETMHSISQEHGIKMKSLYILNHMIDDTEPEIGERLNLRTPAKEAPKVKGMTGQKKIKYYIVKKGDTLYSIARKFKLNVEELKKLNKKITGNISPGDRLVVGY